MDKRVLRIGRSAYYFLWSICSILMVIYAGIGILFADFFKFTSPGTATPSYMSTLLSNFHSAFNTLPFSLLFGWQAIIVLVLFPTIFILQVVSWVLGKTNSNKEQLAAKVD
jgi:hypothetical protein